MTAPRRERSDVLRHRAALLKAARQVFAERGAHAPLDAVVEAAGVGRATLYRHFPDRTALLIALLDEEIESIGRAGDAAPPDEALFVMIAAISEGPVRAPALSEAWRAIPNDEPRMAACRQRLAERFAAPLAASQAAGRVRADLTTTDMSLITRMISGALRHAPDGADRRIIELLLDGVRTRG